MTSEFPIGMDLPDVVVSEGCTMPSESDEASDGAMAWESNWVDLGGEA